MREIIVGCFLFANILSADCSDQKSQSSFDQQNEEIEKKKAEVNEREQHAMELFKRARKEREEFVDQFSERQRDHQRQWEQSKSKLEEKRNAFDQSAERFERKFLANQQKLKEELKEKNEEFDALGTEFLKELQKQPADLDREKREIELLQQHFREEMKAKTRGMQSNQGPSILTSQHPKQCLNCSGQSVVAADESSLRIFISFSVPESTWLSLSQELEKVDGVFVLRGLPNQSFQALAQRILKLKECGVNSPIQLDPKQFKNYRICQVPSFVVADATSFDRVNGNVSLEFALEKMSRCGETPAAKRLYRSLKEKT